MTRDATQEEIDHILALGTSSKGLFSPKVVRLKGDFSKSAALAWTYNKSKYGGYCPVTNNCKHYVDEILSVGSPKSERLKRFLANPNPNTFIPDDYIKRLIIHNIVVDLAVNIAGEKAIGSAKSSP